MAAVKYLVREYTPKPGMPGTHGFYVQAKTDNIITNKELAKKVENRGISRQSEIKMILEEVAKVILEEISENNRVQIETGEGVLVSLSPKAQGSLSDKDVQDNPEKYNNAQVATQDMLTPDMIQWSIVAQVGTKYSKHFALQKTAQRANPGQAEQTTEAPEQGDNGTNTGEGGEDDGLEG